MTTTTVDTQAIVAGSGGTSTPVKLTLQDNTSRLAAELKVVTTRAAGTHGVTHTPFRPQFTLCWAFSADDITLANVPTELVHCTKRKMLNLDAAQSVGTVGQREQIADKVNGQYCYFWFEYPASVDAYAVTIKTTESFQGNSANPSFTSLILGDGTSGVTPASVLQTVDTGTATPRGPIFDQYNNGTNSSQINLRKARGTRATPLTIVSGDVLSRIISWGHDGTNFIEAGNLRFTNVGTVAATRVASDFSIWVNTDAAPSVLTQTANFSGSGGITFTAVGSNQSITLTPSGTGKVIIANGLAATPSLVFAVGTTTGFFSSGPGVVGFSSSGTNYWNFNGDTFAGANGGQISMPGQLLLSSTNVVKFGATSAATIGISANTTAGNLVLTGTTTGGIVQTVTAGSVTLDTGGGLRVVNLATVSAPTYAKGVIYFDTTLNKLRVGGAAAFETITSA